MTRPLLAALSLAATLAIAPQAQAADCQVTMTVRNPTGSDAMVEVESRTRANPGWFSGGFVNGRVLIVNAGRSNSTAVRFPLVGCRINREMRVTTSCFTAPVGDPLQSNDWTRTNRVAQRILRPWGTGYQDPRDFSVTIQC